MLELLLNTIFPNMAASSLFVFGLFMQEQSLTLVPAVQGGGGGTQLYLTSNS